MTRITFRRWAPPAAVEPAVELRGKYVEPGRSKYGARPVVVDGIRFASQREANRYGELRMLERAGEIRDLTLQPDFALHVRYAPVDERGRPVLPAEQTIGHYRADFAYATKDGTVIEDCKGFRTPLYRWKKKHVEVEYGVRIVEV